VVVVGNIIARRTSVVASGADGKVNEFLVRAGETVEEDRVLSTLNMVTTDLGIAEAEQLLAERQHEYDELLAGSREEEKKEALARMEAARQRLEREEELARRGASNQDDLDAAREQAKVTEAQWELVEAGPRPETIARARARRDAQAEQVEFLRAEKDKRITRAPFAGMVVEEMTERGQWLAKGDPVVTLADLLEEVHVVANVDQSELSNVQLGQTVQVVVDGAAQREWEGTVISVIPRSQWQSGSRAFPVKVSVPNRLVTGADGKQRPVLTEGMIARVTFVGPPRDAVLVPKDAIIRSEAGSRVYAVIPGETPGTGKARPVTIQEGAGFDAYVEILGGELEPGVQVVIEGAERLAPFADIVIQQGVEQAAAESAAASLPAEDDPPESN
jgi:HlyD family secretion protein